MSPASHRVAKKCCVPSPFHTHTVSVSWDKTLLSDWVLNGEGSFPLPAAWAIRSTFSLLLTTFRLQDMLQRFYLDSGIPRTMQWRKLEEGESGMKDTAHRLIYLQRPPSSVNLGTDRINCRCAWAPAMKKYSMWRKKLILHPFWPSTRD